MRRIVAKRLLKLAREQAAPGRSYLSGKTWVYPKNSTRKVYQEMKKAHKREEVVR